MARVLEHWTQDREVMPRLGLAAREHVVSHFDVATSVAATLEAALAVTAVRTSQV
jgi:hypothetical protein